MSGTLGAGAWAALMSRGPDSSARRVRRLGNAGAKTDGSGPWRVVRTGWEPMLCGRSEQLAAIGQLLEGMRSGRAGALGLRGEAGGGETARSGGPAGEGGRGGGPAGSAGGGERGTPGREVG